MYREHTIGVVVPAYNEEGFIGEVIETMPDYVDRVYVIDDCSTDGTWDAIRESAEKANERARRRGPLAVNEMLEPVPVEVADDESLVEVDGGVENESVFSPRIVPIQHDHNRGVGGAIKTGYKHALDDEIEITAVMGGDGQMNPDILHKFLNPIVEDKADYAKGNRLLYKEYRHQMPKLRFIGNAILTFLTKISSGYWKTMDPQNGYTAISKYALENVGIDAMYEYYGYCNDLLVKLNAKGMSVADVAMPAEYGEEVSSIKYRTYIRKVSGMLLRNFFWRLKVKYLVLDFHPLALFYLFGITTSTLGILGGVWALNLKYNKDFALFVPAASSLLVFILGVLFLMFAMLFDMQVNEDKETQIHDR
ncbi:glycosyltransferase family 2 protein [Halovenus rubra]|uniref:Glycosyltransferase family 2 protein n=2 Tax=Halovenus rubra TaxID=869890 RepID=A0ABD5X763_9EURY|nr:glycosyltransferase family 2 protein [Halovenus rubra]